MIFMFVFLVFIAPIPGVSIPTPPNPSGNTPSVSMIQSDSELLDNSTLPIQCNTSPTSPDHPVQPGQDNNLIPPPYLRRPVIPSPVVSQSNSSLFSPSQPSAFPRQSQNNMSPSSLDHPTHQGHDNNLIPPPYPRRPIIPSPVSQSNSSLFSPSQHTTFPRQSQNNMSPSSLDHPTHQGQDNNLIPPPYPRRPVIPSPVSQSNSSLFSPSQPSAFPRQSQNNMSPSSPDHPTHPGQDNNLIPPPYLRRPVIPSQVSQSNSSLFSPAQHTAFPRQSQNNMSPSSPDHPTQPGQNNILIPPSYPRHPISPFSEGQSNPNSLIPVCQRPSQSTTRVPWYHGNEFYAMERAPHGIPPNEFHRINGPSKQCVLNYFFAWGLSYASERPNLSTSIHIQCFLNQAAFTLFILANAVFARTHPALAFIIDRLSFILIVISGYLASLPMFPPYVAFIMFLVVAIVYIFTRFRG